MYPLACLLGDAGNAALWELLVMVVREASEMAVEASHGILKQSL